MPHENTIQDKVYNIPLGIFSDVKSTFLQKYHILSIIPSCLFYRNCHYSEQTIFTTRSFRKQQIEKLNIKYVV